jgi:hypothetical protein
MRRPVSRYDLLLRMLGSLAKLLFISMFICTVLTVLAGLFGAVEPAYWIYRWIWAFFWRVCVTILATIAVVTMLDGWQ